MRTRVLMAPAMGGRRGLGSNEITLAQERPPQGDPQTPQGIHFTGLEAMLSTDRMWRSRLFGGTRTLPSLPERDYTGQSLPNLVRRRGGSRKTPQDHSAQ